ncbi:Alpha-ketoglutarate-dependent dioxygenase alkB-like protein, partial [Stegodyphus mimosarum]
MHKDNETCLEPESDIPIISLGAKRQMIFTRRNFISRTVDLTHRSLLVMKPPTNKFWMHGLPSQPDVKDPRISVTFRNIKISKIKKRRLEENEDELPEDDWFVHYMKSAPENIF